MDYWEVRNESIALGQSVAQAREKNEPSASVLGGVGKMRTVEREVCPPS